MACFREVFPRGRGGDRPLRSPHPDDPCGRDRLRFCEEEAAPKEQPAPETLRQTDRRRMGLWKVACASRRAPTDEVSRQHPANLSGLRTEGVASGAVLASGYCDSDGDLFDRNPCRPPQAHAALRLCTASSARASCRSPATRCRCSTRPAFWPSMPRPGPRPACSTSRTWARCGSPPSPATTRPRRWRPWCRPTSRACSPASSATPSSPTIAAASSTI